jgi:spoIIIJ-associated protein
MKPENVEMLKSLVKEILEKMTFSDFSLSVKEEAGPDGENVFLNISSKESDLLIGQYGINLRSLQHILRAMARKKTEERLNFSVDVNDYRQEKMKSILDLARGFARQAVADGRPVVMRPMSAYERRIVHMDLAGNDQVRTESVGEGEERKVVIKPVGSVGQDVSIAD